MKTKNIHFCCLVALIVLAVTTKAIEREKKGAWVTASEITADSLLNEADNIFQSRDYQAALDKYMETVELAQKEFNRSVETEALAQIARMHLLLNNKQEGRNWLVRAGEKVSDSDPMGFSRYMGVKGRFEWKDDDLKMAQSTFDKMYNYCSSNALYGRAVDAAHMIALVAADPEEQIKWSYLGIEAAEASDVGTWLGPLWNNLAGIYYDQKNYDSALTCYQKARDYHWQYSGETAKLYADYHVGMTYRLVGKFDEAGQWLRPVLAWAERLGDHSAIGQASEDLGETMIGLGQKAAGLKLLKQARTAYKAAGFDQSWKEVWDGINQRISDLGSE